MHISTKINIFLANFVDCFCFAFKSTPKILAVSSFKTLSASMSYRVPHPPRDRGNCGVLLDAESVDSKSDLSEQLSKIAILWFCITTQIVIKDKRQNWNVFLVIKLAFLCVHVSDDPDGFEYVTFSPLYQKYHGFITALDSCCCHSSTCIVSQPDKTPELTGTHQCTDTCVMSWWLKS